VCHVGPVNNQEAEHAIRAVRIKISQKHRAVMMLSVQVSNIEYKSNINVQWRRIGQPINDQHFHYISHKRCTSVMDLD